MRNKKVTSVCHYRHDMSVTTTSTTVCHVNSSSIYIMGTLSETLILASYKYDEFTIICTVCAYTQC